MCEVLTPSGMVFADGSLGGHDGQIDGQQGGLAMKD